MRKFKKLLIGLAIALSITATAYGASYTLTTTNITLNVNGSQVSCMPLILNGTTYLPLRTVAETLGADVQYTNSTRKIDISTLDTKKLAESCVMLYADNGKQGSGVYIDYGKILTCDHVTRDSTKQATSDKLFLTLDKESQSIDASILNSPDTSVKPVKIGDSDEVKKDDKIIIISSPNGEKNKILKGNVIEINPIGEESILLWANTKGGSSGGACFNMKGELIGIVTKGLDGANISTVIPINKIRKEL